MTAIQEIVEAISCRLGEIFQADAELFSTVATPGLRDGKKIYFSGEEELVYKPISRVFAYHVVGDIKPSTKDPWSSGGRKRPSPADFLVDSEFFAFFSPDFTHDAVIKALLAFNIDYKTTNASADISFKKFTNNFPKIIAASWPDKWDKFQDKQTNLHAIHISYLIDLKSCKIC